VTVGELIDHQVPTMVCPGCGTPNDGALTVTEGHAAPPAPGDVGVCAYCAMVSVYEVDRQRPITTEEYRELRRDNPDLLRAIEAVTRHPSFGRASDG
jgi:hypothetical protein